MTRIHDVISDEDFAGLPGADLVLAGLKEIRDGAPGEYGMLVLIASPRLNGLGLNIPASINLDRPLEHELYSRLELSPAGDAYSRYNALLRSIASFCHALEQQLSRATVGGHDNKQPRSP